MRMGLREAHRHFSSLMKAVKGGKEVELTERGKPIAVIEPLRKATTAGAILRRLEAVGPLQPATKRTPMPPCKPLRLKGTSISATLREERDLS